MKLAFDQQNRKKSLFWHISVFVSVFHRMMLIDYTHSSQFMEWQNLGITTLKQATCSQCF